MNPDQNQSGIKTWQWVTTVIVIIVLIIIGIWVFGGKGAQAPVDNSVTTDNSGQNVAGAINRIVMSDQYPGNVVYLSSVQLVNPGWVVIQADNAGQPGKILGETYFTSGINPGKITLSQPMVDGGTYYAVLYDDTDGTQTWNATADQPLKDASGNIIMKVFHGSAAVSSQTKG
jgi:hypothetical protein